MERPIRHEGARERTDATADIGTRIVVIGSSGAGKNALARRLAERLGGVPHVELDALHFAEDWVEVPDEVFAERADAATASGGWVIDGNYSAVTQGLVWPRPDAVVWLDYPFRTCARRLLRRTVRRSPYREALWHGTRESFRMSFASRDSILLWLLRTFRRRCGTPPARASRSCASTRRVRPSRGWRVSPTPQQARARSEPTRAQASPDGSRRIAS